MARNTFNRDTEIAKEIKFFVAAGMDEDTAVKIATTKIDMMIEDKKKKEDAVAQKEIDDKKQKEDDRNEVLRIAALLGREVPEYITRFVVSTVAIKEEQEIDGVKKMVETGRRVSKVRLYFTLNDNALEVNQLIKTFKTEEEVGNAVEEAKMTLLALL